MTSSATTASWTALLAGAVAHDLNNFVHGVSTARTLAASPGAASSGAAEMAATIEADLEQVRKLGIRLRTLACAAESQATARLDEACRDALVEVDHRPEQRLRSEPIPARLRVVGTPAALRTIIAGLLEHALAASPPAATVSLAVHAPPGAPVSVEIAAPQAVALGTIDSEPVDVALATTLPELRGDASLILPSAIADALGGSVTIASDVKTGLVLTVHLVTARPG